MGMAPGVHYHTCKGIKIKNYIKNVSYSINLPYDLISHAVCKAQVCELKCESV